MLFILALVLLAGSMWMAFSRDSGNHPKIFLTLLFSGVIIMVGSLMVVNIAPLEKQVHSQKIVSLEDRAGQEGTFVLGSGTIESSMYYYYMKDQGNGRFRMDKIDASTVDISFSDDPRLETSVPVFKYKIMDWLFFGTTARDARGVIQTLYVPKDTIQKSFNIDLK